MRQSLDEFNNIFSGSIYAPHIFTSINDTGTKIAMVVKKFEEKYTPSISTPERKTLEIILTNAINSYNNKQNMAQIDIKETKYLPLLLFMDFNTNDNVANYGDFCVYLINVIIKRKRITRAITTIIREYLRCYSLNFKSCKRISKIIINCLNNIQYKTIPASIQHWKNYIWLFNENGTHLLAQQIDIHNNDINNLFNALNFDNTARYGGFMKESIKDYYTSSAVNVANKIKLLDTFFTDAADDSLHPFADIIPDTANVLIPQAVNDVAIQAKLRNFYLFHLQDPRRASRRKWDRVSPEAKKIFIQWLAKFDLETFFNVVRETDHDPGREYRIRFWGAYLPYFENTWVALGPDARQYVKYNFTQNGRPQLEYASLTRGSDRAQSLFLFQIRGYLFSEWGHNGLLRVWKVGDAPVQIGDSSYDTYFVKSASLIQMTQRHFPYENYGWQRNVETWLLQKCGIRPSKSYRLSKGL